MIFDVSPSAATTGVSAPAGNGKAGGRGMFRRKSDSKSSLPTFTTVSAAAAEKNWPELLQGAEGLDVASLKADFDLSFLNFESRNFLT